LGAWELPHRVLLFDTAFEGCRESVYVDGVSSSQLHHSYLPYDRHVNVNEKAKEKREREVAEFAYLSFCWPSTQK
jgi:hypothetical protein